MPPYRKVKQLGQGGFGVVFHEVDEATGRDVAIKYLNAVSPDARERFEREARHLYAQLNNKFASS